MSEVKITGNAGEVDTDLLDIDTMSFAGATAHAAAANLYTLLGGQGAAWPGQVVDEGMIEAMGAFVASRSIEAGETLWRQGMETGWWPRQAHAYADLPFAQRQAFDLFVTVCASVHSNLSRAQKALEAELDAATAPPPPGLEREDSIFEEHEPLDKLVDHGAGTLKQMQGNAAAKPAPKTAAKPKSGGGGKAAAGKSGGQGKALSIGEAPHSSPGPNKGGRPRKTSTRPRQRKGAKK